MRTAVVVFPGTNCERDVVYALGVLGGRADLVWHRETDLSSFTGVILPGGFAHGDYLRTGAIARFSPVMETVKAMADEGKPVLGICNGFQARSWPTGTCRSSVARCMCESSRLIRS